MREIINAATKIPIGQRESWLAKSEDHADLILLASEGTVGVNFHPTEGKAVKKSNAW